LGEVPQGRRRRLRVGCLLKFKSPGGRYGVKREEVDGRKFDSRWEAAYYRHLKLQEIAGRVKIIECQPKVYLTDARILMKPDFLILDLKTGLQHYVDVKGIRTPVFQLKRRLWACYGPLKLVLVKKKGKHFEVIEEILTKVPRPSIPECSCTSSKTSSA
jgi:Protein of unknown function (DUF1064)